MIWKFNPPQSQVFQIIKYSVWYHSVSMESEISYYQINLIQFCSSDPNMWFFFYIKTLIQSTEFKNFRPFLAYRFQYLQ